MKLSYDLYTPPGGENASDECPVILLHGRLDSRKTWKKIAPRLAEETGRKVFAPDARNHGESPWSDEMDLDLLATDVEEFMADRGIQRALLVGHSMGGKTAITLALRKPEEVEKLVVEDMTVEAYSERVKNTVGQIITLMRQSLAAIPADCRDETVAKEVVHHYVKSFVSPGGSTGGGFMFDAETLPLKKASRGFAWQANLDVLEDMLKHRAFPMLTGVYGGDALFLYGDKSFFDVEKDDSIPKYFPRAQVVCVRGAGHLIHQDFPEEFTKRVIRFIKGES